MVARLVSVGLVLGLAQLVLAGLFAEGEAAGHARYHALFAVPLLVAGGALVARWPDAGLGSRAPALGLATFAAAQLIESLGAFGYDALNDRRINGFAEVHDVGMGASALGLVLALLGVGVGLVVAANRLRGSARTVGLVVSVGTLVGGFFLVKTMIGF